MNTNLSTYSRLENSPVCRLIDNYESDSVLIEEVDLNRKWYEKV